MGKHTNISWTDATYNPWYGCAKVSPGCKKCYMFRDMKHYGRDPFTVQRAAKKTFFAPMKWISPRMIFTCSWSDFFIEDADPWRAEAWKVIRSTPQHVYQILTKRPERICDHLPPDWGLGYPNVWLGVSVETQAYLTRFIRLHDVPVGVRFVSYEPALGPLTLGSYRPDWLISGGESGYNPRLADPDWFRAIRDECAAKGIPFFHKQNGGSSRIGGTWGGRDLDGRTHDAMPVAVQRINPTLFESIEEQA